MTSESESINRASLLSSNPVLFSRDSDAEAVLRQSQTPAVSPIQINHPVDNPTATIASSNVPIQTTPEKPINKPELSISVPAAHESIITQTDRHGTPQKAQHTSNLGTTPKKVCHMIY